MESSEEAKISSTLMKDINRIRKTATAQIKMNILRKHQLIETRKNNKTRAKTLYAKKERSGKKDFSRKRWKKRQQGSMTASMYMR